MQQAFLAANKAVKDQPQSQIKVQINKLIQLVNQFSKAEILLEPLPNNLLTAILIHKFRIPSMNSSSTKTKINSMAIKSTNLHV